MRWWALIVMVVVLGCDSPLQGTVAPARVRPDPGPCGYCSPRYPLGPDIVLEFHQCPGDIVEGRCYFHTCNVACVTEWEHECDRIADISCEANP